MADTTQAQADGNGKVTLAVLKEKLDNMEDKQDERHAEWKEWCAVSAADRLAIREKLHAHEVELARIKEQQGTASRFQAGFALVVSAVSGGIAVLLGK